MTKDRSKWTYKQKLGEWGEDIAQKYLEDKGYLLVDRNVSIGHKEIDLIFTNGKSLIVVEVKTRMKGDLHQVQDSIKTNKVLYLSQAAHSYAKMKKIQLGIRFDLIYITIQNLHEKEYELQHIQNAFYPPLRGVNKRRNFRY